MTISDSLHFVIDEWLGKSKKNNLYMLADKLSIPYPSLNRFHNGKVKKPKFETIMALTNLLSKEDRLAFLDEFYPAIAPNYRNSYFENKPERIDQMDRPDLEKLFAQRDSFFLGMHLLSRCGITEEKIQELYGSHGLELVKELEKEGSVQYDDSNGVWRISVKDYISNGLESSIQQVQHSASAFKADSGEVGAGYIRNVSESVTLEAARKIRNELDAVAIRIDKIAMENPGEHVFMCNVLTQLLDPKAALKEDQGEREQ